MDNFEYGILVVPAVVIFFIGTGIYLTALGLMNPHVGYFMFVSAGAVIAYLFIRKHNIDTS